MTPDDFERQLKSLPLRPLPPRWRAAILARAAEESAAAMPRAESALTNRQPEPFVAVPWWRVWLWPCPQAWAGLAAVWILLLGLHLSRPAPSSASTAQVQPPNAETQMARAAQRREMSRLLDLPVEPAAKPPRPVPGPRSERSVPAKA